MKPKILVITSTVRENRLGRQVADWYKSEAKKAAPEADFELLDIAELNLPMFNEPIDPLNAENSGKLTEQQKKLAEPIDKADGFVIVTGEYNHTIPGPLKNFLDFLPPGPWKRKAVAFVGYGASGGGLWSILHLIHVMTYLKVVSMIDTITIKAIWAAFDESGAIKPEHMQGDVGAQLKELLWWVNTLKASREK